MANYNTFAVVECKHGKILLITSSARKALELMDVGKRIEVWNNNQRFASITYKVKDRMRPFVRMEKNYIKNKQDRANKRNN